MSARREPAVVTTIEGLRRELDAARSAGARVGLVPTMGYFHAGHRSLMRAARDENDVVVVSLFVNPTQFAPDEDLACYPRDFDGDRAACGAEGVDLLFAPPVEEMYPGGTRTTVHVEGLTAGLCGRSRPHHFDGVTTVVAKLFSITGPCRAYFGRKDAQQVAVIRTLVRDLNFPVEVVACPLVRESDGLAMSSRNAYLTPSDRVAATALYRGLRSVASAVESGGRDAEVLRADLAAQLDATAGVELEYAEVVDAETLEPVPTLGGDVLVAVAARVGATRLIDNVTLHVTAAAVAVDLGTVTHHEEKR